MTEATTTLTRAEQKMTEFNPTWLRDKMWRRFF